MKSRDFFLQITSSRLMLFSNEGANNWYVRRQSSIRLTWNVNRAKRLNQFTTHHWLAFWRQVYLFYFIYNPDLVHLSTKVVLHLQRKLVHSKVIMPSQSTLIQLKFASILFLNLKQVRWNLSVLNQTRLPNYLLVVVVESVKNNNLIANRD